MQKRKVITLVALGALALPPLVSSAAPSTKTAVMAVTMTVISGCSALTATPLAFPATISAGSLQVPSASGTVSATCATGVAAILGFNSGANPSSGTVANLKGPGATGTQTIAYGIWSNAAHTVQFPTVGTPTVVPSGGTAFSGTGSPIVTSVFGAVAAVVSPTISPGAFLDTITATLYF